MSSTTSATYIRPIRFNNSKWFVASGYLRANILTFYFFIFHLKHKQNSCTLKTANRMKQTEKTENVIRIIENTKENMKKNMI